MKCVTRQLIIGAFVLILVTVASLCIRHARFRIHRARAVESPVITDIEPASVPAELNTIDVELDPKYVDVLKPEVQESSDEYSETHVDSDKDSKAVYKIELSKGEHARAKGSKGLEKVSLVGNDNLYRTAGGGLWYVSKGPDGKSFKMQLQIDESTGKVIGVGKVYGDKSANPEKISISGNEDIYITEEGQAWYVTDDYKAQVEIEVATSEIIVVDQHDVGDDK